MPIKLLIVNPRENPPSMWYAGVGAVAPSIDGATPVEFDELPGTARRLVEDLGCSVFVYVESHSKTELKRIYLHDYSEPAIICNDVIFLCLSRKPSC